MDSRQVIKKLRDDGWYEARVEGSHHHFKHHSKNGIVTVIHPKKDFQIKTILSMEKQSGLKFR